MTEDRVTRAKESCLNVLPKTLAPRAGLIRRMIIDTSEAIGVGRPGGDQFQR